MNKMNFKNVISAAEGFSMPSLISLLTSWGVPFSIIFPKSLFRSKKLNENNTCPHSSFLCLHQISKTQRTRIKFRVGFLLVQSKSTPFSVCCIFSLFLFFVDRLPSCFFFSTRVTMPNCPWSYLPIIKSLEGVTKKTQKNS